MDDALDAEATRAGRTSSRPRSTACGTTASTRSAPTCREWLRRQAGADRRLGARPLRAVVRRRRARSRARRSGERRRAGRDRRRPPAPRRDRPRRAARGRAPARDRPQDRQGERARRRRRRRRAGAAARPLRARGGALLDAPVVEGRLYYCTSVGAYTERVVPLDIQSTAAATAVAEIVGAGAARGLPAGGAREERAARGATIKPCAARTSRCASSGSRPTVSRRSPACGMR